jgi:DNA-binding IclR family transcriptional regulator
VTRKTDYTNAAQQRLLQLVNLLAGNELAGLAPSQIARDLDCNASVVTRDLDNLKTAGWAEQTPKELWKLTPHVIQLSVRFGAALAEAGQELRDISSRYGHR